MSKTSDPLLEFACFQVIAAHENLTGEAPTGLYFNKALSLLHRRMREAGTDLKLPHCWYRWGDEVVVKAMPRQVRWERETEPPKTKVKWEGATPENSSWGPTETAIRRIASELAAQYAPDGKIGEAVSLVYSYAPFPFQQEYREVRELFFDLSGAEVPIEEISPPLLTSSLTRAMEVFPHVDFPQFSSSAEQFRTIVLAGVGTADLRQLRQLAEAFWFAFCYHLRLHPRAHENVLRSHLDYWESHLPAQMQHYQNVFRSVVLAMDEHGVLGSSNGSVSEIVKGARDAREEDLAFIDSFGDSFEGIENFSRSVGHFFRAK